MPPRTPLQELNPNRVANGELSIEQRNRILGARDAGATTAKIVNTYGISSGAVENTIRQEPVRDRSSRPIYQLLSSNEDFYVWYTKIQRQNTPQFAPNSVPPFPKPPSIGSSRR